MLQHLLLPHPPAVSTQRRIFTCKLLVWVSPFFTTTRRPECMSYFSSAYILTARILLTYHMSFASVPSAHALRLLAAPGVRKNCDRRADLWPIVRKLLTPLDCFVGRCVFCRQRQDERLRRGGEQKSVVVLSGHPYISVLEPLTRYAGMMFFNNGPAALQTVRCASLHDNTRRPSIWLFGLDTVANLPEACQHMVHMASRQAEVQTHSVWP